MNLVGQNKEKQLTLTFDTHITIFTFGFLLVWWEP